MNCDEARSNFGEDIDAMLAKEIRAELHEHLAVCRLCRKEYDLEVAAKQTVKTALRRVPTPLNVRSAVLASLRADYESTIGSFSWLRHMLGEGWYASAVAAGIAVIAAVYFFFPAAPPSSQLTVHSASNDIIYQSLQNFAKIRDGRLRPSTVACDPSVIASFFERKGLEFAVSIKSLEDCDWYGALASTYGGVSLAHFVYRKGEDLVYVYEVKKEAAMDDSTLAMPPACKTALLQTGWYTDPQHPDCNVIVWTSKGTLCSAVSNLNKQRLFALLTSN